MKIYKAVEYGTTDIPVDELVDNDGSVHLLPEVKGKGYIDIDYRGGALRIVAGRFLGQIPVTKNVVIDVRPRISIGNLINVVIKSNTKIDSIPWFLRNYLKNEELDFDNVFDFFAKSFSDSLNEVVLQGVWKQYIQKETVPAQIRGRLDFKNSINRYISKGHSGRVVSHHYEFSADHPANQLVAYTLNYCLKHLQKIGSENKDLIESLRYRYRYFERFYVPRREVDLLGARQLLSSNRIPNLRKYYSNIINVALAIINETAIELDRSGEDIEASSFVIDMSKVFESYIRSLLSESPEFKEKNVTVIDGNISEDNLFLFTDSKKFPIKPDLLIRNGNQEKLVIEVKYKPRFSENDRYQVLSHAVATGVSTAVLVRPLFSDSEHAGINYIGTLGVSKGIQLYEYCIDLRNPDYTSSERAFSNNVAQLINRQ